jgi:GH24 family phage-related lysozyme (muramidase)
MRLSDDGLSALASDESFVGHVYRDFAGHRTIGYGHLMRHGDRYTTLTEAEARELLRLDVASVERAVTRLVRVPLTQGQFDALVSFTFNVGSGALAGSTLLRLLNSGDYDGAAEQFRAWVRYTDPRDGQRKDSPTLIRRRSRERERFLRTPPLDVA